jgi:hypothetical protein
MRFKAQPNPDVKDVVLGILLDSFAERVRNGGGYEDGGCGCDERIAGTEYS